MRVRCIAREGSVLPSRFRDPGLGFREDPDFAITVGKVYVVYAFGTFLDLMGYFLSDDDDLSYPRWYSAPLFEVTDWQLSRYWRYGYQTHDGLEGSDAIVSFPEWVSNPRFFDDLTDGAAEALATFRQYKRLIDEEAAALDEPDL